MKHRTNTAAASAVVSGVHHRAEDRPFNSFGEFALSVRQAHSPGGFFDPRLRSTAINTAVGSEGGFAVPAGPLLNSILGAFDDDVVLSRVRRIPVSNSREVSLALIDESGSRADDSRHGGVTLPRVDEGEAYPYTSPKIRRAAFAPFAVGAIVPATEEWLRDTPAALETIDSVVGQELAFQQAKRIINDKGAGGFLGLLASSALITVAIEAGQTIANTATHLKKNAANMLARVHRKSRAVLLAHPENFAVMVDAGLLSEVDAEAPFGRLATRPVFPCEQLPAPGTVGDFLMVDLSDYALVSTGTRRDLSIHVRFEYGESLLRFTVYADGQPSTSGPITPYTGTLTTSPIVALATRL